MAPIGLAFAVLDSLHGSKTDLGIVLAARGLPQAAFILVGGVISDRLPRHAVMVGSNVVSMLTQGTVAVLLLSGHAELWHLVALSAVNGISSAFFFPASAGIIPQTVPEPMIQSANALLRLALNTANVLGAALGGILVAAAGPGWTIAIDAASFGAAAIFTGLMTIPAVVREHAPNFVRELSEGWDAFRSRSWLWSIVLQFSVLNAAFVGAFQVLGPSQAKEHYSGGLTWGLILAAESAGLISGGILMLHARPQRMLLLATFATLTLALPLALLGKPAPAAAVAVAALIAGLGLEVFAVCWDTTMQQQIPGPMLSRVYSYDALGSICLVPVGFAVIGPVAEAVGTQTALYGAALLCVAATLPVFLVRDVRELRRT
jgi:MFS family permease